MARARYTLDVRIVIRDNVHGGNLQVSEEHELAADGFLEICQVLARFRELIVKEVKQ